MTKGDHQQHIDTQVAQPLFDVASLTRHVGNDLEPALQGSLPNRCGDELAATASRAIGLGKNQGNVADIQCRQQAGHSKCGTTKKSQATTLHGLCTTHCGNLLQPLANQLTFQDR